MYLVEHVWQSLCFHLRAKMKRKFWNFSIKPFYQNFLPCFAAEGRSIKVLFSKLWIFQDRKVEFLSDSPSPPLGWCFFLNFWIFLLPFSKLFFFMRKLFIFLNFFLTEFWMVPQTTAPPHFQKKFKKTNWIKFVNFWFSSQALSLFPFIKNDCKMF